MNSFDPLDTSHFTLRFLLTVCHGKNIMDYEHFYRYLDSRGPIEIKGCVRRVLEVARKHSINVRDEGNERLTQPGEDFSEQHRLQVSQQVWFQHAICSRFGSKSVENMSLNELSEAVGDLCVSPGVGEFIARVNQSIDSKIHSTANEVSKRSNQPASLPVAVAER